MVAIAYTSTGFKIMQFFLQKKGVVHENRRATREILKGLNSRLSDDELGSPNVIKQKFQ